MVTGHEVVVIPDGAAPLVRLGAGGKEDEAGSLSIPGTYGEQKEKERIGLPCFCIVDILTQESW
jgi:hypothetical protein